MQMNTGGIEPATLYVRYHMNTMLTIVLSAPPTTITIYKLV